MDAFKLRWQNRVVETNIKLPAKPEMYTVCPFTEEVYQHLFYYICVQELGIKLYNEFIYRTVLMRNKSK